MAERTTGDRERLRFTRWPGLLTLTVGVVGGPILMLLNQLLIYVANMNQGACPANTPIALHLIPLLAVLLALATAFMARRDWDRVGRGTEDSEASIDSRSRFLALLGIGISALSALLILAQWLAVFVFNPCLRA